MYQTWKTDKDSNPSSSNMTQPFFTLMIVEDKCCGSSLRGMRNVVRIRKGGYWKSQQERILHRLWRGLWGRGEGVKLAALCVTWRTRQYVCVCWGDLRRGPGGAPRDVQKNSLEENEDVHMVLLENFSRWLSVGDWTWGWGFRKYVFWYFIIGSVQTSSILEGSIMRFCTWCCKQPIAGDHAEMESGSITYLCIKASVGILCVLCCNI